MHDYLHKIGVGVGVGEESKSGDVEWALPGDIQAALQTLGVQKTRTFALLCWSRRTPLPPNIVHRPRNMQQP